MWVAVLAEAASAQVEPHEDTREAVEHRVGFGNLREACLLEQGRRGAMGRVRSDVWFEYGSGPVRLRRPSALSSLRGSPFRMIVAVPGDF